MILEKMGGEKIKIINLFLFFALAIFLISFASAATSYYDPTSDLTAVWDEGTGLTFLEIDEGVRQPTTAGMVADNVADSTKGADGVSEFNFDTITETPNNVTLWVYTETGASCNYNFLMQQAGATRCSQSIIGGTAVGWQSCTWTTPTGDYSAMTVELSTVTKGGGGHTACTVHEAYLEVDYTPNNVPNMSNFTASHSLIKGGNTITFYANTSEHGINDTDGDTLNLYCDTSNTPTAANTDCTGGVLTDTTEPYVLSCTFATPTNDSLHVPYCRVYDGIDYSSVFNVTYTTDSTSPSTTISSVAGDTVAGYFDSVNDAITEINISGESSMACRWGATDVAYSSMSNNCAIAGSTASCLVSDVATQGLVTRYVSCQDSLTNEQNSSQNLDVQFTLDYTAPTTSDNSVIGIQVPNYTVTLTESDNVDGDPTTLFCRDTTNACTPITPIDNGGTVVFTPSNRGVNYFRYFSTDDAGNIQTTKNSTININQLVNLSSALDDATTILGGGATVNITTISSEPDAQTTTLWVCNSALVTSSGCVDTQYCTTTASANATCTFASETDSATHTWFAFMYDSLGEIAPLNYSGFYTTDLTSPGITVNSPTNGSTITQNSVTFTVTVNEALTNAWYTLDNSANNVTMTNTSQFIYTHTNLSIADLVYNATFYANDSYGNIGSTWINFTIDSVPADVNPPAITIVSPTNNTYINPTNLLINISADESLEWAGYQLNGSSIVDLDNYSLTNWNITLTNLAQERVYNLTIWANDTSSNQNNKTIFFYADSLAPRYSNAQASPNPSNQSQDVNCSISWTDTYNLANVRISENSTGTQENHTISVSGVTASASYVIPGAQLANANTYACIFYAEDAAGNSNVTTVNFVVNDVINPVITVIGPTNSTFNNGNVTVSLTTSENATSAWYSLNGTTNVTLGNTSTTAWNGTLLNLGNSNYNIILYANDSANNVGNSSLIYFTVNAAAADTVAPVITIDTLVDQTYYTSATQALNVTTNENATWVGYKLNSGSLTDLSNTSVLKWNVTLSSLGSESNNSLEVYANDTASPANEGNKNITFYVDTLAPRVTNITATPSVANETQDVLCNAYVNDTFGLTNVKIEENSTGTFLNHTISLTSTGWFNYSMPSLSKGGYTCIFHVTDAAGNINSSETTTFVVNDVVSPTVIINSPLNQTYSTASILFSITTSENATEANYSLDGGTTNVSLSGSAISWSDTVNVGADGAKTVTFFAIDSSGNLGTNNINFSVDTTVLDTTPPTMTIFSPSNNSYDLDGAVLLNLTTNEALDWAGWQNNSEILNTLDNYSTTNWNDTITFSEGQHNITFYANDTSSNENQANETRTIYVDLNNPAVVSYSCTDVNDSKDSICSVNSTDAVGLDYFIVSYNATGTWLNSSNVTLSGATDLKNFTIASGNHSPIGFSTKLYVYDLSGRLNGSETDDVLIADDAFPLISNISYLPNTTDDSDPGVTINVNATISEDFNISEVVFMYQNISAGVWNSISMTNNSVMVASGASNIIYNVSFVPQNGTWAFKINVTDANGNNIISANTTIDITTENNFWNATTISAIESVTFAQRSNNNTLGIIYLNNTGDNQLNFSLNITSSIRTRFDVNYTGNPNATYSVGSGENISLTLLVNTTSLTNTLFPYNISINSSAGFVLLEKNLNIQTAAGPYLVVSIDTYSSTVTGGQSGLELVASVENQGTSSASDVYLDWILPSGFSLASGSLSRSFGTFGVGSSGTNTITVDVGSSISSSSLNLTANAYSTNADTANDTKTVTVSNPVSISSTPSTGGGGGGGGSGGSISLTESVDSFRVTEVVRGDTIEFEIEVFNKFVGTTLNNLELVLTGFSDKFVTTSPAKISGIEYGEIKTFKVVLNAPAYKSFEEHNLIALIKGDLDDATNSDRTYSETQKILLLIQSETSEDTLFSLEEAEKAIEDMKNSEFNTDEVDRLLEEAKIKLSDKRNGEAKHLADEIILLHGEAYEVDTVIRKVLEVLSDPKKSRILLNTNREGLFSGDLTGLAVNDFFENHPAEEMINLAIVAFERGDYELAKRRADSARSLLLFSIKGNLWFFLMLYWPFVLLSIIIFFVLGMLGLKGYTRSAVSWRIEHLNSTEESIRKLIKTSQQEYYKGKTSGSEYHRAMDQHHSKLAKISKERVGLRNKRINMLTPREINTELKLERMQLESEIKKLQISFYKTYKITKQEYDLQFKILNERLAEIEDEKATLSIVHNKRKINSNDHKLRKEMRKVKRSDIWGSLNPSKILKKSGDKKQAKEQVEIVKKINQMMGDRK